MSGSLLRLWLVVAGVAVGAVIGRDGSPSATAAATMLLAGVAGCGVRRRRAVTLVALFAFGCGCGSLAAAVRAQPDPVLAAIVSDVPLCDVRGRVLERVGGSHALMSVDSAACGDVALSDAGVVAAEVEAPIGSGYRAEGWLLRLGQDGFDGYRRDAGAAAELIPREIEFSPPRGAFHVAAVARRGLRDSAANIRSAEGALVRGLTIGDTGLMAESTLESFRRSGLSHLLAVSGSNVALVLAGAGWLCRRLPFKVRIAGGAAAMMLFVLVVGPDASVLRAAGMGSIVLLALGMGQRAEPLHALGLALAVVIAARPQIATSVGLHLSAAATAGIILWTRPLASRLEMLPALARLPLAVTASAQFAVLPLLLGAFGESSLVAPVANLLAAAAVVPATALGLIGGVVGVVTPALGGWVLRAAEPFASWILFVGETCAGPSWASVEVPSSVGWLAAVPVVATAAWSLRSYGD